jgi:SAM-dependent methyltransferase
MVLSNSDRDQLRQVVIEAHLGAGFRRATFGGVARGQSSPWVRIVVRRVELRGVQYLQFTFFDGKKESAKNFLRQEVQEPLSKLLDHCFSGIHLSTDAEEIDIRISKKGKLLIGRRKTEDAYSPETHNRAKNLPMPEGRADRLFEVMGIMTPEGKVRPTMRAKYRQINEFLKQLLHVLDDSGLRSINQPIEILDCGCGSSYLTLAVHHYLNDVLNLPARITGVDVNEEVIRKSIERSERLGTEGVTFACRRIRNLNVKPHMVIALHACDTATDEAIAEAIRSEAKLLLSVPCCHHDLNRSIRATGPAEVLRPLLRHGILQQRTADLVTDSFRALVLRIMGYRTDVVEFISTEHTARNLMIRAVRGVAVGETDFVNEYLEMKRFWGVTPYIEGALGEPFQRILHGHSGAGVASM